MTTLVLIPKKLFLFARPLLFSKSNEWFYDLNKRGVVSFLLLLIILVSVISYLAALFAIFNSGIKIQAMEKELAKLSADATVLEVRIQNEELSLIQNQQEILGTMEKVSSIKYLQLDNFVFSGPPAKY